LKTLPIAALGLEREVFKSPGEINVVTQHYTGKGCFYPGPK
jgi:hypothetical protein